MIRTNDHPTGRHVYLVPGFFGFSSLGGVNYFQNVAELLAEQLAARDIDAKIFDCTTKPTASIPRRADLVVDEIVATGGLEADEIHLVGHSTGGLDARLLVTPGVRLRRDDLDAEIGAKTRSCVTVATPHYGTPLASFFTTLPGRHVLEIATVLATTAPGRHSLYWGAQLLELAARIDDAIGRDQAFVAVWARRLIDQLTPHAGDPIFEFLREVSRDQGAIIQLTPESMNLFNAAVTDRPETRYDSILTAAPPPPGKFRLRDLVRPTRGGAYALFAILYQMASRQPRHYPYPHPGEAVLAPLRAAVDFELSTASNDGVVPTLSQVYGRARGLVRADHLDVVGQYDTGEPFADWLPCGAGYDDRAFRRTWNWVADSIAEASRWRAVNPAEARSAG